MSMKRHLLQMVPVAVLLCWGATNAFGFRVLLHVGHDFTATELLQPEGWTNVAARADGVWSFDAWTRTIRTKEEQDRVLGHINTRAFYLAEFHFSPFFVGEDRRVPNPVIDPGVRNGFNEIWCMSYHEPRYGSTLSVEQIAQYRQVYPDYKLISNIRVFNKERFAAEFAALDGVSYEFNALQYGDPSEHHPGQTKIENVIEAIRWSIDNDKLIVLLMPPGDDRPTEEHRYVTAIREILVALESSLEKKYLESDRLVLVPATYDCRRRKVHNTPEKQDSGYANTGMGATLACIEFRDR